VLFLVLFKIFYPSAILYIRDSIPNGKRVALVIGNSHYPDNVLPHSQNDAKDIAKILRGYHFTVIHKQDLNQAEMDKAILEFKQSLTSDDIGLFYFAGHGIQINQQNYLMPIDLKIHKSELQLLKYHAMNAQYPIDVMKAVGSRVKIVILDVAPSDPFNKFKKDSSLSDELAAMYMPTGTIISYSTALDKKSFGSNGKGRNSLYTSHLLEVMKTPGLAIKQVFRQAAIQVTLASDGKQVPWHSDSLTDEIEIFCFITPCQKLGKEAKNLWQEKEVRAKKLRWRVEKWAKEEQKEKSRQAIIEFQLLTKRQSQSVQPSFFPPNNTQFWFSAKVFSDRLFNGGLGPKMVMMPAGSFRMGIKDEGWNEERPKHRVSMAHQFAMGQNEVTVAEFRRFVKATGYKTDAEEGEKKGCWIYQDIYWYKLKDANWRNPYFFQNDNHPVVCVSWNDAVAYAKWLSEQTDQQYYLPSEAEWEYAARAKTSTQRYWGNNPDHACHYANVADQTSQYKKKFFSWIMQTGKPKKEFSSWVIHNCIDGYIYTAPVGSFKQNNFGLYDMLGNVWEWCADPWHSSYKNAPIDGSIWDQGGENSLRVIRGGAWNTKPKYVRTAFRFNYSREDGYYDLGFRLSRFILPLEISSKKGLPERIKVFLKNILVP
jgi:formylglycine-generating enzyme required for sulfatase activity